MGRQVSTTSAPKPLSFREAGAKIEALHGCLEEHPAHPTRYCVPRSAAPSIHERQQLVDVRAQLEERLLPCDDDLAIEAVVSQFLIGFEHGRGGSDLNTEALNGRYVKALRGLPLAAVQAAVDRFDSASTILPWNRAFRPSPAELCAEAGEGMVPLRTRLLHLRRVLDAEVYDPPTEAERAKVQAAAASWLDRSTDPAESRTEPAVHEIGADPDADAADTRAAFAVAAGGGILSRLMGRLRARAPQQDAEVQS